MVLNEERQDIFAISLPKPFIDTKIFSKSSRLHQRQVERRQILKEVRRLFRPCFVLFLHDPDLYFLAAMKDDSLTTR